VLRALADQTKFFKYPAKPAPIASPLANGFIGNTWRIQMIKTAKAYAEQPDVKAKLKEFKVVSTGEDVAAQIAAVNNFIDSGYDAIVINAQNPTAFAPVIKRAKAAGVILVAFDNILDTEDAINVDVDQKGLGVYWAKWLMQNIPNGGKILEVRGVAGTSVDTDRHNGIHETLDASGKKWDIVEVVGKWDDGTAQKVPPTRLRCRSTSTASPCKAVPPEPSAPSWMRSIPSSRSARNREWVPQALRRTCRRGPEMRLRRHRPGAGCRRHQDRDRSA